MNRKAILLIFLITLLILATYFFFDGLVIAKPFLAPLSIAVLLALLMIPVCNRFERWGLSRGWASFLSVLILMAFFTGLFAVISVQVKNATEQWPELKKRLEPRLEQLQDYIADVTGFSKEQQEKKIRQNSPLQSGSEGSESPGTQGQSGSSIGKSLGKVVMAFLGFLGTSLLTFIYIFFFLLYRSKVRKSILRFVSPRERDNTTQIIYSISKVSQKYLFGKFLLMIVLSVLYSIGLLITGVQNAILISILAAVLSLLPFVGNIIGYGIALAMGLFSGNAGTAVIGITLTFAVTQFIETYVLEPYVVGDQVEVHPIFIILAVVLGSEVWGVMGMVISIPVTGILKVIADHIPVLHPVGYTLGLEQDKTKKKGWLQKIKRKFSSEN